jgi:hypothetical protein
MTCFTMPRIIRVVNKTLTLDEPSLNDTSPQSTSGTGDIDRLCWHCCHPFEGPAIPFPKSYDEKRRQYSVFGSFCSFACVSGYNRDRGRTHPGRSAGINIFHLYKDATGSRSPPPTAPPRELLRAFGGHMSIHEFRSLSETASHLVLPPNCITSVTSIMQTDPATSSKSIRNGMNKFVGATQRTDTLKLSNSSVQKRQNKSKTLLESALGI